MSRMQQKINHVIEILNDVKWQLVRDFIMLSLLVFGVNLYKVGLDHYTKDLAKPLFLEVAFYFSLSISCVYELNPHKKGRYFLLSLLQTVLIFVFGVLLALYVRDWYVSFIHEVQDMEGIKEFMGEDLYLAITTRYVGYGGSFAIGVVTARLMLGRAFFRRLLESTLVLPEFRSVSCPMCGRC